MDHVQILKNHVEKLGLDRKDCITFQDQIKLFESLKSASEYGLAQYVSELQSPDELEDLIVNTLYGDE